MTRDPADLAERALQRRKHEDGAIATPLAGCLLLASPLLNIFSGDATIFGIPVAFVYVFTVWAGLIIVTRALARRLSSRQTRP
ncbi:hypothetical protein [Oceanibium sediminis]|uniref:hypothetical protein n=1 Tax=Oceanibium sediminis TaxID=2026339 RepID=UPI0018E591C8|nr:hypothetical protein [Oceanibium sediminis]